MAWESENESACTINLREEREGVYIFQCEAILMEGSLQSLPLEEIKRVENFKSQKFIGFMIEEVFLLIIKRS